MHIIYCQSDLDPLWWGKLIWYDSVQKAEQEEDYIGATTGTAKYAIIASIQGSLNERGYDACDHILYVISLWYFWCIDTFQILTVHTTSAILQLKRIGEVR